MIEQSFPHLEHVNPLSGHQHHHGPPARLALLPVRAEPPPHQDPDGADGAADGCGGHHIADGRGREGLGRDKQGEGFEVFFKKHTFFVTKIYAANMNFSLDCVKPSLLNCYGLDKHNLPILLSRFTH